MNQVGNILGLFLLLTSFNLSAQLTCETISTYGNGAACKVGTWQHPSTWSCSPPINAWQGKKIIISHPIRICNNGVIDISESELDTILIKSGGSIEFRANAQLILPEDAIIILEDDQTVFSTNNNSQGTYLAFGGFGVWGRECCCNDPVPGPLSINKSSVICTEYILPIELTSFTAQEESVNCLLKWATNAEFNNEYFELEHSFDMIDWSIIHVEPSKGNASSLQEYEYLDTRFSQGETSYYRLTQTDYDGHKEQLKTISFKKEILHEKLHYFPSIIQNQLTIRGNLKNLGQIFIYDLNGSLYIEKILHRSDSEAILSFDHIKSGTYFVALEIGNKSEIIKLIKTD